MDEKLSTPVPPSEPKPTNKQKHRTKKPTNQENYDGIRFRGILEVKTNKQSNEVTKHLKVTCNVTDIKRQGKLLKGEIAP